MALTVTSQGIAGHNEGGSVIDLCAIAGRRCLADAGIDGKAIGVIIYTGVYRDFNMGEPSVAALVQMKLDIGHQYAKGTKCFAFDLNDSSAGVLTAIHVVDSILDNRMARYALVLSGDTHPSTQFPDFAEAFPFAPSAAAILLERTETPYGFGRLHSVRGYQCDPVIEGYLDLAAMGNNGRSVVTYERKSNYGEILLGLASAAARRALQDSRTDPRKTLVLCPWLPPKYSTQAVDMFGVKHVISASDDANEAELHTAGLTNAFRNVLHNTEFDGYGNLLFVAAGAGPVATAMTYRRGHDRTRNRIVASPGAGNRGL